MNHDLLLHESILLLSLDDEKGNFATSLSYLNYGFASALLMDLVLEDRIYFEDGLIKLKTNAITENKLLNEILKIIYKAKKPKKVSGWLHTLVALNSKYIPKAIDKLIKKGILQKAKKKILWVFNFSRYPTINAEYENQLRSRIRDIIFEDSSPQNDEILLLTILQACQMIKHLIPDKEMRKTAEIRIKKLTNDSHIRQHLGSAIEEMETLVTVVTTTAI